MVTVDFPQFVKEEICCRVFKYSTLKSESYVILKSFLSVTGPHEFAW